MRLANQIGNPLQLLVEVLKTHIDQFKAHFELEEQDQATRVVANQEEFDEMDLQIDLLVVDEEVPAVGQNEDAAEAAAPSKGKRTLQIADTGPGFSHR